MPPAEDVPTLIRELRAQLGEDVATFGARWHRSGRTVENWEQGRPPDALALDGIRKLAARRSTNTSTKKTKKS
jgi:DNA-binding transcriptional regulator YiaG